MFAEFESPEPATNALATLKSLGYLDIETYSPFPLTYADARAPRGSFVLGALAFGGGLCAAAAAYLIQWYANVASYALNIGGRPVHAAAAFVPSTFESICLVAAMAVCVGFLVLERLPRLWQPIFEIDGFERSSVDRFWIVVQLQHRRGWLQPARHVLVERAARDLAGLHPLRIIVSEDEV
jgi:hypothetical protein